MNNKIIYKNYLEIKILNIVMVIIFIPCIFFVFRDLIINSNFYSLLYVGIPLLVIVPIIYIINRFKIVFDYDKKVIIYTNYFKRIKIYNFDKITCTYTKTKTTLLHDYTYTFYYEKLYIFKFSNIDFEGQTKEKEDRLHIFFSENQKKLYNLQCDIQIERGCVFIFHLELKPQICIGYANDTIGIILGYDNINNNFNFEVLNLLTNTKLQEDSICSSIDDVENIFQDLVYKYQFQRVETNYNI